MERIKIKLFLLFFCVVNLWGCYDEDIVPCCVPTCSNARDAFCGFSTSLSECEHCLAACAMCCLCQSVVEIATCPFRFSMICIREKCREKLFSHPVVQLPDPEAEMIYRPRGCKELCCMYCAGATGCHEGTDKERQNCLATCTPLTEDRKPGLRNFLKQLLCSVEVCTYPLRACFCGVPPFDTTQEHVVRYDPKDRP